MSTEITSAILGASVPTAIAILAYCRWRSDFALKAGHLRDSVTEEQVRLRLKPYAALMKELKAASSKNDTETCLETNVLEQVESALQNAIYGEVGLLSSHESRQLIVHCRAGCRLCSSKSISHRDLMLRFWALHLSLRSDLGISQPEWESVVEKAQKQTHQEDFRRWEELVRAYPWEKLETDSAPHHLTEANSQITAKRVAGDL